MPKPLPASSPKLPLISRYTIFAILTLILVLLAAGWWAYSSYDVPVRPTQAAYNPTVTLTPTGTLTPTATATASRTPRPTWTVRVFPTDTATVTPTSTNTPTKTRIPTITAARPYKYNDRYEFVSWSADLADQAAQMAFEHPDIAYPKPENKTTPGYHAAYAASVYAYREALLRFPDDPRATSWQWRLAYSLAQVGDPKATDLYAGFIQEALKRGDLRAEDLPRWFQIQEPHLTLLIHSIPVEPGQLNQDLIKIQEGGVFLWLVETPSTVRVLPITPQFNFEAASQTTHLLGDLTGAGKNELAIYQPDLSQPAQLAEPKVFSLADYLPVELPVQRSQPYDLATAFALALEPIAAGGFSMEAALFPACPVTVNRNYTWAGDRFAVSPLQLQVEPQVEMLPYCEPGLRHALIAWKPAENIALLETLLPFWPPALDLDQQPYPADAKDELRYWLGIHQALDGKFDQGVKTLQDILSAPAVAESRWVEPAARFLTLYSDPGSLYRACQQETSCNLRFALEQVTHSSQASDLAQLQEYLRLQGISLRSSGIFDFDQDGIAERWVVVQPRPEQALEFWILVSTSPGIQALYIDQVTADLPSPYYHEPVTTLPPAFQIEAQRAYQLIRGLDGGRAFARPAVVIPSITTYTRDSLFEAQETLLSGGDPALVRDSLLEVLNSGRFNCLSHRICDRFYYTLGLAYELAGDLRKAIDTYIQLWWENSRSPYTKMARLKIRLINPTPTSTRVGAKTATPGTPIAPSPIPPPDSTANPYPGPNPYP